MRGALTAKASRYVNRSKFLPAAEYLNYVSGHPGELIDEVEGLHVNEEPPLENGGDVHEVNFICLPYSCNLRLLSLGLSLVLTAHTCPFVYVPEPTVGFRILLHAS